MRSHGVNSVQRELVVPIRTFYLIGTMNLEEAICPALLDRFGLMSNHPRAIKPAASGRRRIAYEGTGIMHRWSQHSKRCRAAARRSCCQK